MSDLANTPLQTIRLGVELLRDKHSGADGEVLERIDRAAQRLAELNGDLVSHTRAAGPDGSKDNSTP